MKRRQLVHVVWLALFILIAAELFALLFIRTVNLDEGWYLWASKLVYADQVLYQDFAYTQTPLLPYIYGAFQLLFGEGLYQGRILTVLLSFATIFLSAQIAYHRTASRSGLGAALFCLLLATTTLYALAYFSYTATYGLATFFIVAALYVAQLPLSSRLPETVRNVCAIILMWLAIATRMSVIAGLLPLMLYLVAISPRPRQALLWLVATSACCLGLLFVPFFLASDGLMLYDIVGFHTDRILRVEWQVSKVLRILRETLFIFSVPLGLSVATVIARLFTKRTATSQTVDSTETQGTGWWQCLLPHFFEFTLALMALGMFMLHLVPRTTSSYYHALEAPLLWILGGIGLQQFWASMGGGIVYQDAPSPPKSPMVMRTRIAAFMLAGIFIANGLINVWAVWKNDLVDLPPQTPQIEIVRAAAHFLQGIDRHDNLLLTFNTHLALEAGMDVPQGYEMSIFAYRPTWDVARARQYKAINNEILIEGLVAGVDAVAITDWDLERFYGERERIQNALDEHYRWAKTVPGFDPFHNNLRIYLPPQFGLPPLAATGQAQLDDGVGFLGFVLDKGQYSLGDTVQLNLYWQATAVPQHAYTVFTHILNAAGQVVAGWDNPPCHRTCPTTGWQLGEVLYDEYMLALPADLPAGTYMIEVGMYDANTGTLLPVQHSDYPVLDARIQLGTIQIVQ